MSEYRSVLERIERRVSMPEPAMERLLRRQERKRRNERIRAAVVALGIAGAGVAGAFVTLRVTGGTQPASGGGETATTPEGGFTIPTVAIWTAIVVLGLTVFVAVRLRGRFAHGEGDQGEPGPPSQETPRGVAPPQARTEGEGSEMDSKAKPDVKLTQTGIPEARLEASRVQRVNRWLVGAVVVLAVALVSVGTVAIADRSNRGVAPTKTVATAAYTTSSNVQSRVVFDGSTCAYSGPAEVAAGTDVAFDYTSVSGQPSAMIFVRLSPGMTYEDVLTDLATHPADEPPSWVLAGNEVESEPTGAAHQSLTSSPSEGAWAILCGTSPETTNKVFMATMLRVVGG